MASDLAGRIDSGRPAAVGIRELHLETSKVIKAIADGTRLVVTNHGSPRAVIFSMRDAVELALEPRFAMLGQMALVDRRDAHWAATDPFQQAWRPLVGGSRGA